MTTALKGIIRGKNIELAENPGLPNGQQVAVEIHSVNGNKGEAEPPAPWWMARLEVSPAIRPGKFVVRGTCLLADGMVGRLEEGWGDEKLLQTHPELVSEDIAALREYAQLPAEMRRCFGVWADDAEDLDGYLEWNRRQRKSGHEETAD